MKWRRRNYWKLYFVATGEPAICMAVSVFFAIRDALNSARKDSGINGWWQFGKNVEAKYFLIIEIFLDGPATVEKIRLHNGVSTDQFVL